MYPVMLPQVLAEPEEEGEAEGDEWDKWDERDEEDERGEEDKVEEGGHGPRSQSVKATTPK